MVREVAGYDYAKSDVFRRAIGKKDQKLLDKSVTEFTKDAVQRGYDEVFVNRMAKAMVSFGSYSWNVSHAVSYTLLTYATAYFKAHYPVAFMCANLNHAKSAEKMLTLMQECDRMKIKFATPDINESVDKFVVHGDDIMYGITSISGIGDSVYQAIISERTTNGPFKSFKDFCDRLPPKACNKLIKEALIFTGAFDSLPREMENEAFAVRDTNVPEKLAREFKYLKRYVTMNPIEYYESALRKFGVITIHDVKKSSPENDVRTAGVIYKIDKMKIKSGKNKGKFWAILNIGDGSGYINCRFFSRQLEEAEAEMKDEFIVGGTIIIGGNLSEDRKGDLMVAGVSTMRDFVKETGVGI
jgi:DNA polymerase III subunit alpha